MAVVSSEGSAFFNGRSTSDFAMWNKLWDGAGLGVERVGRGTMSVRDARGSLILAIQEGEFEKFRSNRGAQAMDMGFLARFLFSRPPSNIGMRFINQLQSECEWKHLENLKERVGSMLRMQAEKSTGGFVHRKVLRFDPMAEQCWINISNKIETMMQPGQAFHTVPSYASKIAENISRLAAIFHCIENREGDIGIDDVDRAIQVCEWHSQEFLDCFGSQALAPQELRDANVLEKWLLSNVWRNGKIDVKKNDVRQFGPNQLRNKARLDDALRVLCDIEKVRVVYGLNKTRAVSLNPNYFSCL